ncbi:hypothetical protein ABBQ38_004617 [Trebouxia sp. C0009 RCD-2024]
MRDVENALRQLGCRCTQSVDAAKAGLIHPFQTGGLYTTALTLHPVPLSEAGAVLNKVGLKVEALQKQLTETKTDLSELKEQILLGQAAYTFASLVEDYVFDGAPTEQFPDLSTQEYPNLDLTTEQQTRWERVQKFASAHVERGQLIKIDKMLRKGHFELAHGEEKNKKKATLKAMEGWAARYNRKQAAVRAIKGYLRMLNQFSSSALPLLPNKKIADVLVEDKQLDYIGIDCVC